MLAGLAGLEGCEGGGHNTLPEIAEGSSRGGGRGTRSEQLIPCRQNPRQHFAGNFSVRQKTGFTVRSSPNFS